MLSTAYAKICTMILSREATPQVVTGAKSEEDARTTARKVCILLSATYRTRGV